MLDEHCTVQGTELHYTPVCKQYILKLISICQDFLENAIQDAYYAIRNCIRNLFIYEHNRFGYIVQTKFWADERCVGVCGAVDSFVKWKVHWRILPPKSSNPQYAVWVCVYSFAYSYISIEIYNIELILDVAQCICKCEDIRVWEIYGFCCTYHTEHWLQFHFTFSIQFPSNILFLSLYSSILLLDMQHMKCLSREQWAFIRFSGFLMELCHFDRDVSFVKLRTNFIWIFNFDIFASVDFITQFHHSTSK